MSTQAVPRPQDSLWEDVPSSSSSSLWEDVPSSKRPDFAARPPGVPSPVPKELQPGGVMTRRGPMSYSDAAAAGPYTDPGLAESAGDWGIPAADKLKEAVKTNALAATYAAQGVVAPETLLGRMALMGGTSGAQSALMGGDAKDVATSAAIGAGTEGLVGGGARALERMPSLRAKMGAVGKLAAEDAASHIPGAGRLARRPSVGDYWEALKTKPPAVPELSGPALGPETPDPSLLQGNALRDVPATGAQSASQTGEALGNIPSPAKQRLVDQVNAYRSRSIGEEGIPYRPESHAQASMSEDEARGFIQNREDVEGNPQELVGVDLSQAPGFSVRPGPNGPSWVKFHGEVPESAVTPRLVDQVKASAPGTPPPAEFSGDLDAALAPPPTSRANIGDLLEKGLGGKRLDPNVPLKDQMMQPQGEHLGQFARANGLELEQAIPKTPAGDALRGKIHNLRNIDLRQLMINLGEDMGQTQIGNSKFRTDLPRQDAFSQLLKKFTPEQIGQAIDQGFHQPLPADDLEQRLNLSLKMAPKRVPGQ